MQKLDGKECPGTQGMELSREGDEDVTWVVTVTILNREPATLASPAASQAHKRDQYGYLGCKTPCRGQCRDPKGVTVRFGSIHPSHPPPTQLGLILDSSLFLL